MLKVALSFFMLMFLISCNQNSSDKSNTEEATVASDVANADSNLVRIAKEAYIYGMPLVILDVSRRQFEDPSAGELFTPPNTFNHKSNFPDANFRSVVRPNADTYYSTAMLDLSEQPVVLSLPSTNGRYYMMPMLDAYTNVFASPGTRTTGNEAGIYLVTGPKWTGTIPQGMKEIKSPTNNVWLVGRTQVNSKADGDKIVVPLQHKYKLVPLSFWGKTFSPPEIKPDPSVPKGDPNAYVKGLSTEDFFNYMNQLLEKNPPPAADKTALEEFVKIGVVPGKKFELSTLPAGVADKIKNLPSEVFDAFDQLLKGGQQNLENGWRISRKGIGTYGTNYNERALIAYMGLGANLPEDAIYPSTSVDANGNALNGANKYVLHFDKGKTPPANAFWSLTMYDPDGYMVANAINRNAIGDRSNLKKNSDGSVDIIIQNESPGKAVESNWLPAPKGDFNVLLRVYWPKTEMLDGSWNIPAIKKL
ncbi:DUF1254 domain-containing protein [Pollutibacter soli]|uniref:DUF1254 domain-containing protein n=1 Tax=Pollutibacter soli TaxID=3034157 RepID=UPI003013A694